MTNLRWIPAAWSLEVRQLLSHRADFWLDFLGSLSVQIVLAFFLWKAIFRVRDVPEIGGYTFASMMLYYLMVPLIERITRGHEIGFLSTDIYQGSLNRYLVMPIDVFVYKYVNHLAVSGLGTLQLILAVVISVLIWEIPESVGLSLGSFLLGLGAAIAASLLYFLLAACLEMVSFWADNVWSLLVMLRFMVRLLGGGMIPLALFPAWSQPALEALPFSYLLSFPIRTAMGQVDGLEYLRSLAILSVWTIVFYGLARWIFRRGSLRYSGVGI